LFCGLFLLGYLLFQFAVSSSKSSHLDTHMLWTRLKERLFDEDLPAKLKEHRSTIDMNEIGSNSPSPGFSPTHMIQETQDKYPERDRNRLEKALRENDR
jgi:hypothetical protein